MPIICRFAFRAAIKAASFSSISALHNQDRIIPPIIRKMSTVRRSFGLPSCIMRGFIIMPKLNLLNCGLEGCEFCWQRLITKKEYVKLNESEQQKCSATFAGHQWYEVSRELTYQPVDNDVAHILRFSCTHSDGKNISPLCTLKSNPVEIGPSMCPFEKRFAFTSSRLTNGNQFRVVTYNILADVYAHSEYSKTVLFGHCPTYALDVNYRRQLLFKEITGYNANIICLQEVDKKEFLRIYEPYLRLNHNYVGLFACKGGQIREGPATFICNDVFEVIESHVTLLSELIEPLETKCSEVISLTEDKESKKDTSTVHPILKNRESEQAKECLAKFQKIRIALEENDQLKKRFIDRHTVLQTTLIRNRKSPDNYLIVANTHLFWAPDADHIRLIQGITCVKYLEHLKEFYTKRLHKECERPSLSLILCGDMNSTPDCGLYKLLTEGFVPETLKDWSSNVEEKVVGLSSETKLRFRSAYEKIEYTNYTPGFHGCLDYIFLETDRLSCESTVPLPDHNEVVATGGIPSDVFPSDHLALIANIKLI